MPTAIGPILPRIHINHSGAAMQVSTIQGATILLSLAGCLMGQQAAKPSLPVWPDDGLIPKGLQGQYAFMTKAGDALIVLLPKEPEGDLAGPKRAVRVPLNNRLAPSVRVTGLQEFSRGMYRYSYEICNGAVAKDSIEVISVPLPAGRKRFCMSHGTSGVSWGGPCGDNLRPSLRSSWPANFGRISWTRPDDAPAIDPGRCLGGFAIESDYLPGLAPLSFWMHATRFAPDRMNWPEEVLSQVGSAEEPSWFEKYYITIAPAIAPEKSQSEIAAHFLRRIEELEKAGRVRPQSPFMIELKNALEQILNVPHPQVRLSQTTPATGTEEEILRAVGISLGISVLPSVAQ